MGKKKETLGIVMLGQKQVPSREGGIEVVVGQLATRMASAGHHVTCLNRMGQGVSGSLPGVVVKTVPCINKRGLAAVTASVTGAAVAAFGRCDVVHFHGEGFCTMLWLPKLLGKRCIATIHGLDHKRAKWGKFASSYILLGEKCAVRFADKIIVLSRGVQQYFRDTYGRETILIPNGVEKPAFRAAEEITRRFGLEKDGYILYLGRLVPEKGISCLIGAFRRISTDKKLVIAGVSSDTDGFVAQLREQARGDDRILFTGFVQGRVLEELYSNAFCYVLPSELEGMPLSLLEAMSYGNCCVTSDIEECAAVMETHGLTFPKGDTAALAALLQRLCAHPQMLEPYRKTAADFVLEKYNWDDITKRTLELYQ